MSTFMSIFSFSLYSFCEPTWKKREKEEMGTRSKQCQNKVRTRSEQGQNKVRTRSEQDQNKVRTRSEQGQNNMSRSYLLATFTFLLSCCVIYKNRRNHCKTYFKFSKNSSKRGIALSSLSPEISQLDPSIRKIKKGDHRA